MYLPLCKVADTPFHIQGDDLLGLYFRCIHLQIKMNSDHVFVVKEKLKCLTCGVPTKGKYYISSHELIRYHDIVNASPLFKGRTGVN